MPVLPTADDNDNCARMAPDHHTESSLGELWDELLDADEQTRAARAERLRLIRREGTPPMGHLLFGGHLSMWALHEATVSYVQGAFLGCILLAQCCLEHLLSGQFAVAGRDDLVTTSYRQMIDEARALDWLTENEAELFDRLRDTRNPYAHPRTFDDPQGLVRRMIDTRMDPDRIAEDDATEAVLALIRLVNRPPFGLYA